MINRIPRSKAISGGGGACPDVSTLVYLQDFYVNSQDGLTFGLFVKPDGTIMYTMGQANDSIYQYSLSTPWNISTATYVQSFYIGEAYGSLRDLFISPDGLNIYANTASSGSHINQFEMSVAWDISTATYVQSLDVSAKAGNPYGSFFKADGTAMYIANSFPAYVHQYALSTPWDISTAVWSASIASLTEGAPYSVWLCSGGTNMYIHGGYNYAVQYALSTPWDISTATYLQHIGTGGQTGWGLNFSPDALNMYGIASNVAVRQWSLSL